MCVVPILYWFCVCACIITFGVVSRGGFRGFQKPPSEIARVPTIRLGDKNYKELYILYYIMPFLLAKLHTFAFEITFKAFKTSDFFFVFCLQHAARLKLQFQRT